MIPIKDKRFYVVHFRAYVSEYQTKVKDEIKYR